MRVLHRIAILTLRRQGIEFHRRSQFDFVPNFLGTGCIIVPIANKRATVIPQPYPVQAPLPAYERLRFFAKGVRPNIEFHSAGVVPVIKNSRSGAGTFGSAS